MGVNEARQQFLARSAFALDQHGGLAAGQVLRDAQQLLHVGVGGDDLPNARCGGRFLGMRLRRPGWRCIFFFLAHRQRPFDHEGEHIEFEGFEDVIEGPVLHGLHRRFDGAVRSHHEHRLVVLQFLDVLEQLEATAFGHGHVRDDHGVLVFLDLVQGVNGVVGGFHRIPAMLEGFRHGDPHFDFVVNDQNGLHTSPRVTGAPAKEPRRRAAGQSLISGNMMVNFEP